MVLFTPFISTSFLVINLYLFQFSYKDKNLKIPLRSKQKQMAAEPAAPQRPAAPAGRPPAGQPRQQGTTTGKPPAQRAAAARKNPVSWKYKSYVTFACKCWTWPAHLEHISSGFGI